MRVCGFCGSGFKDWELELWIRFEGLGLGMRAKRLKARTRGVSFKETMGLQHGSGFKGSGFRVQNLGRMV
jgi:hypothetical protein